MCDLYQLYIYILALALLYKVYHCTVIQSVLPSVASFTNVAYNVDRDMSKKLHQVIICNVITLIISNFNDNLTKPHLKFGHGCEISPHSYTWKLIIYPSPIRNTGLKR